jgi:hypothetical protein
MFKKKIFNLFVFPFFASLICVLNIHFCEVKNEKKYDLQLPVEPMTLDGGVLFS